MGFLSAVFKWIPVIISAVAAVERLATTQKGKEKQDAAIAIVGDLIPLVEQTIPREVVDEAAVQDAMRAVISAFVQLQNVVRDVLAKRG